MTVYDVQNCYNLSMVNDCLWCTELLCVIWMAVTLFFWPWLVCEGLYLMSMYEVYQWFGCNVCKIDWWSILAVNNYDGATWAACVRYLLEQRLECNKGDKVTGIQWVGYIWSQFWFRQRFRMIFDCGLISFSITLVAALECDVMFKGQW